MPAAVCAAQNLVPNPSFENYISCPTGNGNIYQCTNWKNFGNSPDCFNACAPVPDIANVPHAFTGYQYAHTGVGMAGIVTWLNPTTGPDGPNYREFIGTHLLSQLIIGQKYYFSFYTNYSGYLKSWKEVSANKIGLRFCTVPSDSLHTCSINNLAHLFTDSILKDTVNWIRLSGSFIADSAYNYVALGNFFDDAHTDTLSFGGAPFGGECSYYYIDDVCVSTDSIYNQTWAGVGGLNNKNQISIYPNPAFDILNITSTDELEQFQLINSLGQITYSQKINNDLSSQIYIRNFPVGIYFLRIKTKKYFATSLINIVH